MLAAILMGLALQSAVADPGTGPVVDPQEPVHLEDVVVEGRRLDDLARRFVDEIAAPVQGRGIALWRNQFCVGAVNFDRETAEYITDRVSTVAKDLGLDAGGPGCEPNVVIMLTDDGAELASMMSSRPRRMILGGGGMDGGFSGLRDFRTTEAPVRWWHISAPVDSQTGRIAVRLPGYVAAGAGADGGDSAMNYAPRIATFSASRLSTQIRDDLLKVLIVVDVDQVAGVSLTGLADYLAMISLAQIDMQARPESFDSILNLFSRPEEMTGLTAWDQAFLNGMYEGETWRAGQRRQVQSISDQILRSYRNAADDGGEDD